MTREESVAPTTQLTEVVVPATATSAADRGAAAGLDEVCDLDTVRALAGRHPDVGQWIVTRTDSWTATAGRFDLATRADDGSWVCRLGDRAALVGRSGTRPLLDRRSGDGTTPAGVFPLGTTTAWDGQSFQFFGNGPDPGVRGTYRAVQTAGAPPPARPPTTTCSAARRAPVPTTSTCRSSPGPTSTPP